MHQSKTESFRQDSGTDESGEPIPARTGEETHSITVVNGTTTIETHSITSSTRLAEGTIPHEQPLGTDEDPYAIPTSWIEAASSPVSTSSDTASNDTNGGDSGSDSELGSFTSYDTGLTTTTTATQIMLDDGTPAIEKTVTLSWYAGFSWRSGGDIGNDLLGDDANSDLPAGTSSAIPGRYQVFASASIGGHFAVSTVTITGTDTVLADEGFVSAGFAATALAGGSVKIETNLSRDESSGSVEDNSDTRDYVNLTDTTMSSGSIQ